VSDEAWEDCKLKDVLEAFEHHPRIGDVESLAKKYANTAEWAAMNKGHARRRIPV
jgi:2-oxo-4-hydroxy-4-carboxy-5-ureidoimidazoline decarboxylase